MTTSRPTGASEYGRRLKRAAKWSMAALRGERSAGRKGAAMPAAVVVSFYAGNKYYYEAAARLRASLDRLGIDHDIVELSVGDSVDWIAICARKIAFYRDMLLKHRRPILWVDVDTQILRAPDEFLYSTNDLTLFLRNFKYLPTFDPHQFARLAHPGYLRFAYRRNVLDFLGFAVSLVQKSRKPGTDDYYLQRAFMEWPGKLSFGLANPDSICQSAQSENYDRACFMHKASGNVDSFVGKAAQDVPKALTTARQKRVLAEGAKVAAKKGRRADAIVFLKRAWELDKTDATILSQLLTLMRREKAWSELEKICAKAETKKTLRATARRQRFESLLDRGEFEAAAEMRDGEDDPVVRNFMKSRHFRRSLDLRAEAMGATPADRVKLWWMETPYPGNLGDIINPYIVEKLTGVPPVFTSAPERLLMIGSIIKFARPGTDIWGTGCPDAMTIVNPDARFHAVRGPLTRDVVLRAGGDCPEVYGDPAWLLPRIYKPRIKKAHKLGLILHHIHEGAEPPVAEDVRRISIRRVGYDEIEAFLDEMLSCEAILSTSMHGVIIAHAYGIPVRYCSLSSSARQLSGDGMKFEDYFLSVGRSAPEPLDLGSLAAITSDLAEQCVDGAARPLDVDALLASAPFNVLAKYKARRGRS